jgi:hypothetical protein
MQDVMIDLETLGNRPGCAILSLGAVGFDPKQGEISDGVPFYAVINTDSCVCAGLGFDRETLDWWGRQAVEARTVLEAARSLNSFQLATVLERFELFLNEFGGKKSVRIWGNGADFDNPILAAAYRAIGKEVPWSFWNSRCYRTLKILYPDVPLKRTGTHHNALDDAKTQAMHALEIFAQRQGMRPAPPSVFV